jgi:hypothetical protein
VILCWFSLALLTPLNFPFIFVLSIFAFRATFYFTNSDYRLIRMTYHPNYSALARIYSTAITPLVMNRVVIVGANIYTDVGYEVCFCKDPSLHSTTKIIRESTLRFRSVWVDKGIVGLITRGLHRMRFRMRLPDHFRCSNKGCVDLRRVDCRRKCRN